jgi:hypothetical protein
MLADTDYAAELERVDTGAAILEGGPDRVDGNACFQNVVLSSGDEPRSEADDESRHK